MKILVYDVAAEYGGAMTVLRDFYREVLEKSPRDIQWVFVVSQPGLEDTPQVKILRFSKPKKSRLHRLAFEHLDLPKILAAEKPDAVISLQNMPVARYGGRQFVLLHQSLQFCDRTFSFLKREERSLALQQRIVCRIYRRTLPKAEDTAQSGACVCSDPVDEGRYHALAGMAGGQNLRGSSPGSSAQAGGLHRHREPYLFLSRRRGYLQKS